MERLLIILAILVFAAAIVWLPPVQRLVGTAAPPGWAVAALLPLPVVVWGADELQRSVRRRRDVPSSSVPGHDRHGRMVPAA